MTLERANVCGTNVCGTCVFDDRDSSTNSCEARDECEERELHIGLCCIVYFEVDMMIGIGEYVIMLNRCGTVQRASEQKNLCTLFLRVILPCGSSIPHLQFNSTNL